MPMVTQQKLQFMLAQRKRNDRLSLSRPKMQMFRVTRYGLVQRRKSRRQLEDGGDRCLLFRSSPVRPPCFPNQSEALHVAGQCLRHADQ